MRRIFFTLIAPAFIFWGQTSAQTVYQDTTFTDPVVISFANEFVSFQNCRFENITGTALSIEASGVFLSGCTFENIVGNAIESTLGELYLLNDTIRNVSEWGIVGQYGVIVAYDSYFEQIAGLSVYGEDCDVLEVSGCTFETVGAGIYSGSTSCEVLVSKCSFRHVSGSLSAQFMGHPVSAVGGAYLVVEACTVQECTGSAIVASNVGNTMANVEPVSIQQNTIVGAGIDGISGNSSFPNAILRGNDISLCGNTGISWSSPQASIEGNHVHQIWEQDGAGIVVFQTAKLSRNLVHDCKSEGIGIYAGENQSTEPLQVFNNVIYRTGGSAIFYDGHPLTPNASEPEFALIKNNTLHIVPGTADKAAVSIAGNSSEVQIIGNILIVHDAPDTNAHVVFLAAGPVLDQWNIKAVGDIGFMDYGAWDFHLASEDSPAHDFLPPNFGPPNDDFDGQLRSGRWDAGADELPAPPPVCGCTNCPEGIPDLGSKDYYFGVASADNNDLSNGNQGVCSVRVTFEHEYLGDLSILLVSPAGQVVQLIGPSGFWGPSDFTSWDVRFVPCSEPAVPDPGFSPTWSSNQAWGLSGAYSGIYHPAQGCLENFNTGSVIGNWTLRVFDNHAQDTGLVRGFEVQFCNTSGVSCLPCVGPPQASFSFNYVEPWAITLQNQTIGGAEWYTVDYGDGNTASGLSVPFFHEYENAGSYLVQLFAHNSCGVDTFSTVVNIQGSLPIAFAYFSPSQGCTPVQSKAIIVNEDHVDTWHWLFPGGTPSESFEKEPTVTYEQPGIYTMTLILGNEVGITKIEHLDTITALPGISNLSFTVQSTGGLINCTNNTLNANSFYWTLNGGAPAGHNTSPYTFQVDTSGTYTVTLFASDECQTKSTANDVQVVITSVSNLATTGWTFSLSPNPNNGVCALSVSPPQPSNLQLQILNALGQVVHTEKASLFAGEQSLPLNLSHLPAGSYVLQAQSGAGVWAMRFVRE